MIVGSYGNLTALSYVAKFFSKVAGQMCILSTNLWSAGCTAFSPMRGMASLLATYGLGEWWELRSTKLPVLFCRSVFQGWSCLAVPIFPPCFMSSSPRGSNFAVSQGFKVGFIHRYWTHSFSSLVIRIFLKFPAALPALNSVLWHLKLLELRFFLSSSCSYGGWGDCFCLCNKGLNF